MINLDRVKKILMSPESEWPVIAGEGGSVGQIISGYLIWLLVLSAIATFIKYAIFGTGFFFNVKMGIVPALTHSIAGIVTTLLIIYLVSLLINALAPTFGGEKNSLNAFKVAAYSSTAGLLGGLFNLVPFIGWMLAILASLYGIYLLFTGLPVLMKSTDKTLPYTLVIVVITFLIGLIIGIIASLLLPDPSKSSTLTIGAGNKSITVDGNTLDKYTEKVEAASKKMEQAAESGNVEEVGKAAAGALATIFGAKVDPDRKPIATQTLKTHVPDSLAGMQRSSFEVQSNKIMGFKVSEISGTYENDQQRLDLKIVDLGAGSSVISAMAGWALAESEKENQTGFERTFRQGERTISESGRHDGSSASMKVMLANGVAVEAKGRQMTLDQVRQILEQVDLDALEAAK